MLGKKTTEQFNTRLSSVIGADMVVEGKLRAKDAVRVEGILCADIAVHHHVSAYNTADPGVKLFCRLFPQHNFLPLSFNLN